MKIEVNESDLKTLLIFCQARMSDNECKQIRADLARAISPEGRGSLMIATLGLGKEPQEELKF